MKWPWNISDAEYVRKVECMARWRRPAGLFMVVISAIFVGMGIWFLYFLEELNIPLMTPEPNHLQQIFKDAMAIGLMIGFAFGSLFFMACFCTMAGVYTYFAHRKDDLLVRYHQRLVELGEIPPE